MALRWAARRTAPSGRTEPLITVQCAVGKRPFGVIGGLSDDRPASLGGGRGQWMETASTHVLSRHSSGRGAPESSH